jgi:TolB protein
MRSITSTATNELRATVGLPNSMRTVAGLALAASLTGGCGSESPQSTAAMRQAASVAFVTADGTAVDVVSPGGGSTRRVLTSTKGRISDPEWSPNGRLVAFAVQRDASCGCRNDLIVANADGSEWRTVTHSGNSGSISWSPDSTRLAFQSAPNAFGPTSDYVIDLRTAERTRITPLRPRGIEGPPAWSPTGNMIAFGSNRTGALYTVRPDGTGLRQVTKGLSGGTVDSHPSWSPDGRSLAFDRAFSGLTVGCSVTSVYVVSLTSGHAQPLLSDALTPRRPTGRPSFAASWAPSGTRIVYVAATSGGQPHNDCQVKYALYARSQDTPETLLAAPRLTPTFPVWSPSGKQVAFIGTIRRGVAIFAVRDDGSRPKQAGPTNVVAYRSRLAWSR